MITTPGTVRVLCYDTLGAARDPLTLNVEIKQLQAGPRGNGLLPPVPAPISAAGAVRFLVYDPGGVAGGNVFTDWATMCAAIAALPVGEQPIVSFVPGAPIVIPLVGMPPSGWDLRGGAFVSSYSPTGAVTVEVPDGVRLDNLFRIDNGLVLKTNNSGPAGVLNYSLIPLGGAWVFVIGGGCFIDTTTAAGPLLRSPGGGTTCVISLGGASQGAPFTPDLGGPLLELTATDGGVIAQIQTLGGLKPAPSPPPVVGGATGSLLVILDATGTTPNEWAAGYLGPAPTVFYTSRALTGPTANRPTFANLQIGTAYFDTTIGLPIWWDGAAWINAAGVVV